MVVVSLEKLCSKDNDMAFTYLEELERMSETSQDIYNYFEDFIEMLEDKRSFVRIRAFRLIAVNAKWDSHHRLDAIIDDYLRHIEDDKAFVSRQCIPYLVNIALYKPQLIYAILHALVYFDMNKYKESMQSLLQNDIDQTIHKILENNEISHFDCTMRESALENGLHHCGECSNYPCDIIKTLLLNEPKQKQLLDLLFQYYQRRIGQ